MELKENLTKQNFWNDMMEKYPGATKAFCKWIDEFKNEVNWLNLFNCGSPNYAKQGHHSPKFHDLPYALQLGIWLEYCYQRGGCRMTIENFFEFDLREDIEDMFKHLLEMEAEMAND